MNIPWYLKPDFFLHAELLDQQEALEQQTLAGDRRLEEQIHALERQVRDLQAQLLALEAVLSEKGILPPPPPPPAPHPGNTPALFPARTEALVVCPRCGKRQRGDRNLCLACELPFRYETE